MHKLINAYIVTKNLYVFPIHGEGYRKYLNKQYYSKSWLIKYIL